MSENRDFDETNEVSYNDGYEDIYSTSRKGKNPRKKRIAIINTVIVLISVVFLLAGSALLFLYSSLSRIVFNDIDKDENGSDISISQIYNGIKPEELKSDDDVLNIMVFGADNHSESEYGRSDSMILVSLNSKTKELVMTSFLRDLWVEIPGYGEDRLNAAYSFGGPKLAIETIQQNFGVKIDRYAVVDFESFTNIIDILGGIDLELTDEEIDYINWQSWKNNQVDTRYEIQDSAGVVHLNGRQALWYSRDRDSAGSDFDRTSRQRIVMDTILSGMKSSNLPQILNILYQIGPMIETNLSKGEIVYLGQNALTYLNFETKQLGVPDLESGNFSNATIDGKMVLVIDDMSLEREKIAEAIYGSAA